MSESIKITQSPIPNAHMHSSNKLAQRVPLVGAIPRNLSNKTLKINLEGGESQYICIDLYS